MLKLGTLVIGSIMSLSLNEIGHIIARTVCGVPSTITIPSGVAQIHGFFM